MMSSNLASGEVDEHATFLPNDTNAHITLTSHEGTAFRINTFTLCMASGWFRTLLSLPQSSSSESGLAATPDTIAMAESSRVLSTILSIITSQSIPPLDTLDFVLDVLRAGEKYEMLTVVSVARLAVMSPTILDPHPVRVYGIAASRGWIAEAKLASSKTIDTELSLVKSTDLTSVESSHLVALMNLHNRRSEGLRAAVDAGFLCMNRNLLSTSGSTASVCGIMHSAAQVQQRKWAWWGKAVHPPMAPLSKILQDEALHDLLDAKCEGCKKKLFNKSISLGKLNEALNGLPTIVEL